MARTPARGLDSKAAGAKPRGAILVGTAGWTIPRESAVAFGAEGATMRRQSADASRFEGTHLERYSRVLHAVEINSTFHRSHRSGTYERWERSVPEAFRFCLKAPKTITHQKRLADCEPLLDAFLDEASPLGKKLDCLLFQLPPSFAFEEPGARRFFEALRGRFGGSVACEPRHPSWFEADPDAMLNDLRIARVAADPAKVPAAARPGGFAGLRYFRWHGAPRMYYSSYPDDRLAELAEAVRAESAAGHEVWCVFDNTVTGAAMANALVVRRLLDGHEPC